MKSKLVVGAALLAAFVVGNMFSGLEMPTSNAFNAPEEQVVTTAPRRVAAPAKAVTRTRYVAPATAVAAAEPVEARVEPEKKERSWQKEALIIGGSAGAGAAIGAVSGGKKGAAIGAVSGGIAGLIYDIATRNK